MSDSPYVIEVNEANFQKEVIERSYQTPVVVDFWAPWCQPCLMLGPLLEAAVARRNGQVILAKVNFDRDPALAAAFSVDAIPAVKAFRDGDVLLEFVGLLPEAALNDFLDRVLPTEVDRLATAARGAEETDPAEAERLYREAIEKDANHAQALVGLARVLIKRGEDAEAGHLLSRAVGEGNLATEIERLNGVLALRELASPFGDEAAARQRLAAEPESAQRHYELGVILAAEGKYRDALEALLAAAERDRNLGANPVREAMLHIFKIIGVRSELADEHRNKLRRLIY